MGAHQTRFQPIFFFADLNRRNSPKPSPWKILKRAYQSFVMKAGRQFLISAFSLIFCGALHGQSLDPLNQWHVVATPGQSIRGMAYKDGTFVAVGFSTNIVVSTNGSDWFKVSSGLTNGGLYAVAEGAGQFVAVGPGDYRGTVLSSSNGLQWTSQFVHTNEEYWAVTYGGGQFVAIGFRNFGPDTGAVALTSVDGLQWERFPLPFQTTPRNIVYGNGVYVAAGALFSLYSTNGRDWLPLNSILAQSIAFGAGQFIATVGNNPQGTYRSSNGVDWTEVSLPPSYPITFYTAGFANGTFVLAGEGYTQGQSQAIPMVTSTNGVEWTLRVFTNAMQQLVIRDMVFVDGSFYVGDQTGGKIWKSGRMAPSAQPLITAARRDGGETSFTFRSIPGFRYTIERTDRLESVVWSPLPGPLFATDERTTVTDPNANEAGFYRIRTE
jgi:hypothetical protein